MIDWDQDQTYFPQPDEPDDGEPGGYIRPPKTGDSNAVLLGALMLMVLSGGGAVVLLRKRREDEQT